MLFLQKNYLSQYFSGRITEETCKGVADKSTMEYIITCTELYPDPSRTVASPALSLQLEGVCRKTYGILLDITLFNLQSL